MLWARYEGTHTSKILYAHVILIVLLFISPILHSLYVLLFISKIFYASFLLVVLSLLDGQCSEELEVEEMVDGQELEVEEMLDGQSSEELEVEEIPTTVMAKIVRWRYTPSHERHYKIVAHG